MSGIFFENQQFERSSEGSILLCEYMQEIEGTDKLPQDDLRPVIMGLFGEVGGIMTAAKKRRRENSAYSEYQLALEEEFGDVLWYFTTLCRRLVVNVDVIFSETIKKNEYSEAIAASDLLDGPVSHVSSVRTLPILEETLPNFGHAVAALLKITKADKHTLDLLRTFANCYLQALQSARVKFSRIVRMNIEKTRGRFLDSAPSTLPTFDKDFPDEESLPQHFEIKITQRKNGQSYLQWNGVFIGDPLTDNILNEDDYRFHDIFHFAHAAILHWSPTFRSLIKQKRKSDKKIDETQDGGRAIVVEEGLTAWIFSRAKHLDFFDGHEGISFDLLKTVQQFDRGMKWRLVLSNYGNELFWMDTKSLDKYGIAKEEL